MSVYGSLKLHDSTLRECTALAYMQAKTWKEVVAEGGKRENCGHLKSLCKQFCFQPQKSLQLSEILVSGARSHGVHMVTRCG